MGWYTSLNIPIWYPWTPGHQKAVKKDAQLVYLQPPAELLQAAATFLIQTPTAILPLALLLSSSTHLQSYESPSPWAVFDEQQPYQGVAASDMSGTNFKAARDAYIVTRPWLKFFEACEGLNKKKLANETLEKCQAHLNRERKPPIKKVDVFLWDWSDEDPHELVHTRVTRQEGEDILSSYSDSQLVYNLYSNIWDACEYFGETDNDSNNEPMFRPPSAGISDTPVPSVVVNDKGTLEQAEHKAFCQK